MAFDSIRAGNDLGDGVSFILPVFGNINYLSEAIDSAISSFSGTVEVVVVDDGNHEDIRKSILEIVEGFPGQDIKVLHNISNMGLSASRNVGVEAATYDLVRFLDSDDVVFHSSTDHLFVQLSENDAQVAVGNFSYLQEGRGAFCKHKLFWTGMFSQAGYLSKTRLLLFWDWPYTIPIHAALFVRKYLVDFDQGLRCKEDYDFWLRLSEKGCKLAYSSSLVCGYRLHSGQMTKNRGLMFECERRLISCIGPRYGKLWILYRSFIIHLRRFMMFGVQNEMA